MDHKELIDKARAAVLSDIPQGVTGSVEAISALDDVIAIVPPLITALEAAAQPAPDVAKRAMGLYNKFNVTRTDGKSAPGEKHHNCRYFVLDIDHDKYAPAALVAYANACAMEYPELASDLRSMFATAQPAADVLALVEEAGEVEDCHPTHAADYDLIQRLAIALLAEHAARARAEQERDFAIAHDRQPYPTAWAYDRLAKANIKHIAERDAEREARARAEAELESGYDEIKKAWAQEEVKQREVDALRAELAKLGPVEWQVNTDAIGWRQSTDVEVQHIRSFAVDRVRAIRVVNQ